jgi:hypothetical protein
MNLVIETTRTRSLFRLRWFLSLVFGVVLPLYCFGWLTEALRNRGGLDWDAAAVILCAVVAVIALVVTQRKRSQCVFLGVVRRKRKGGLLVLCLLAISLVAVLAGYISGDLKHDNLRVLVAGKAYRSGQMNAGQLARTVERYGVKSILNLRGENLTRDGIKRKSPRRQN